MEKNMGKRVLVAMSGGVDSSTAAALLLRQGYAVAGITMALPRGPGMFVPEDSENSAVIDAQAVARHLGIAHHVVNAADIFRRSVIDYFVGEYRNGRTPNPCIRCNSTVKFGFLMDKASELGYDYFATGHYARVEDGILKKGLDPQKDQAYFLYVLYKADISRIIFPDGGLKKEEIRAIAKREGLPAADREESQDICFIPDGDYAEFLRGFVDERAGDIIDMDGNVAGRHNGVCNYTIGQRKGLGAHGQRMFVKEIRPEANTVVIGTEAQLWCSHLEIGNCVFGPFLVAPGARFQVRIRYRTAEAACVVKSYDGNRMTLELPRLVKGVAPGQAAVLYDGDCIVGGGTIEKGS